MNEADAAQPQEEAILKHALAYRKPELKFCGACYNCGESLGHGMIFCSADCREDWEKMEAAKVRNGK